MPRYYFHVNDDDDEGVELPDDATAREEAREAFGAMIREGGVPAKARMEVKDETGRRVVNLEFSAEP
jgi:Domain of unknown function (DUF6894)